MARVLMAWELGTGYGHLAPLLTLARALREDGHTVSFVARDMAVAAAVLADSGMPCYPAPANFLLAGDVSLHSYAQILLSTAFNRDDELVARVRAWQSLFDAIKPDVLVVDHAPTALLAARGRDLRCVITGNGFVIPPDVSPLPDLRPWAAEDPAVLERAEHLALERANHAAGRTALRKLARLADLYAGATPALLTFRELDHYAGLRGHADYWGTLPGPGGAEPHWPQGDGKRVFFYGRPYPSLEGVLRALSQGPYRALVCMPTLAPELRAKLAGPRIAFADGLMDLDEVTQGCDAAVMTNGHGTTAAMLLAGKPVVLLPRYLEMFLIARSVEEHGLGLAAPQLKLEGILGKLERVLTEPAFREKAQAFAASHAGGHPDTPLTQFRALVTRLARER